MGEILCQRLIDLQTAIENGIPNALANFWVEVGQQGTPIIEQASVEGYFVTFVWRDDGSTRSVAVIQDWGADGIHEHFMTRIDGTDIWHLTWFMESDTRTTYQLSPDPMPASLADGIRVMPDPFNPRQCLMYADDSGFKIWFSLLELPDAPKEHWINSEVPMGTVSLHTPFEDGRRIWVYLPQTNLPPPYSLLVTFDGQMAVSTLELPQMLDYQLAKGEIQPTIALFIDNPERRELMCKPAFGEYVAEKIIPWARENFPVTSDAAHTVINGSSFGGLCAAYLGLHYPAIFGNVLSQTGWFRWYPDGDDLEHEWLARQFIHNPKQPVRFYLDVGLLEKAQMSDRGPSQLVVNRHMRDVLRAKGYEIIYREYSGGHDYSSTQSPLFEALPLMLGK